MNAMPMLLIVVAVIAFLLVLVPSVRMPLLAELGLACIGLAALGAAVGVIEGREQIQLLLSSVALAATGGLLMGIGFGLARRHRRKARYRPH